MAHCLDPTEGSQKLRDDIYCELLCEQEAHKISLVCYGQQLLTLITYELCTIIVEGILPELLKLSSISITAFIAWQPRHLDLLRPLT